MGQQRASDAGQDDEHNSSFPPALSSYYIENLTKRQRQGNSNNVGALVFCAHLAYKMMKVYHSVQCFHVFQVFNQI